MEVTRERIIADTGLFADLDPAEQAEVAALMRPFELGSEEVLFREGEIADRLYLIARGRVALQIRVDEELVLVRTAGTGDSLSEMALNGSWSRSGTATALEPVVGWSLDTADFDVIRSMGRPLAAKVLRRLAFELCVASARGNRWACGQGHRPTGGRGHHTPASTIPADLTPAPGADDGPTGLVLLLGVHGKGASARASAAPGKGRACWRDRIPRGGGRRLVFRHRGGHDRRHRLALPRNRAPRDPGSRQGGGGAGP